MSEPKNDSSVLTKLLNEDQNTDRFHAGRVLNNIAENVTDNKQQNEQHTNSNLVSPNQARRSYPIQAIINTFHQLELTKHHTIMIILNTFMFLTLLFVFLFVPKLSMTKSENVQEEILLLKTGNAFGGVGGNEPLDDAHEAQLIFRDALTGVTADLSWDLDDKSLLLSLQFHYSNNKKGPKYGGDRPRKLIKTQQPWILAENEQIDQITVYEERRRILNFHVSDGMTDLIVGIEFKTNQNTRLLGAKSNKSTTEFYPGYFLGYAGGRGGGFVDSLQFTWYRYYPKKSQVVE